MGATAAVVCGSYGIMNVSTIRKKSNSSTAACKRKSARTFSSRTHPKFTFYYNNITILVGDFGRKRVVWYH